jgi:hypothetical protein
LKVTHAQDCNTDAPTLRLQMDTVAEGRLTTGGVDIGAAITALTAQSYAGWYISGTGANGHCDKACQDVGLICTETEFAKHIHEVDECAEVGAIVLSHYKGRGGGGEAWTWTGCSPNSVDGCCGTTTTTMPYHNTAVNAGFGRAPATGVDGNPATAYNCATPLDPDNTNPGRPQRLCYCHAAGLSLTNSYAPLK